MAIEDLVIQGEFEISQVGRSSGDNYTIIGISNLLKEGPKVFLKHEFSSELLKSYGIEPSKLSKGQKVEVSFKARKLDSDKTLVSPECLTEADFTYGLIIEGTYHQELLKVDVERTGYLMLVSVYEKTRISFKPLINNPSLFSTIISFENVDSETANKFKNPGKDYVMGLSLKLVEEKK